MAKPTTVLVITSFSEGYSLNSTTYSQNSELVSVARTEVTTP